MKPKFQAPEFSLESSFPSESSPSLPKLEPEGSDFKYALKRWAEFPAELWSFEVVSVPLPPIFTCSF